MSAYIEQSDGFWLGRLSMALAISVQRPDPRAKRALEEFLRSEKPSTELATMLRQELEAR